MIGYGTKNDLIRIQQQNGEGWVLRWTALSPTEADTMMADLRAGEPHGRFRFQPSN